MPLSDIRNNYIFIYAYAKEQKEIGLTFSILPTPRSGKRTFILNACNLGNVNSG